MGGHVGNATTFLVETPLMRSRGAGRSGTPAPDTAGREGWSMGGHVGNATTFLVETPLMRSRGAGRSDTPAPDTAGREG